MREAIILIKTEKVGISLMLVFIWSLSKTLPTLAV